MVNTSFDKEVTLRSASQLAPTRVHEEDTKSVLNKTFGASGTPLVDGYILEEYNPKLAGAQGLRTYDKMRKSDAQVFATLLAMELPIRATKWDVMPATDENGETGDFEHEVADRVRANLFEEMDGTFDDFIREALTMLPFGFSLFEKVWTSDGEFVRLKKLASRKQISIQKWQTDTGAA